MLIAMGARITGAGSHVIEIEGVERLHGAEHTRDRRPNRGRLADGRGGDHRRRCVIRGAPVEQLNAVIAKLEEIGADIEPTAEGLRVSRANAIRPVELRTLPYPGFPTDLQAQMMALLATPRGTSVITETIFENRFMHALELIRMGADIAMKGPTAVIRGVPKLSGAPVMATDLRASMSLVIAGLAAEGTTEISRVYHLDRGYEALDRKLAALGARIERVKESSAA